MTLGIIARSDNTGLGNQTRELVKMLNPDKILLIDSQHFNGNEQHPEWYKDYNVTTTLSGFPTKPEVIEFLRGIDVVLSCETFYRQDFLHYAKRRGIKTILQYNFEFLLNMSVPEAELPDVLLAPSLWNIDQIEKMVDGRCKVIHLPPPTDSTLFENVRQNNMSKDHNRLLHVGGKFAAKDRNGTETVLQMLKYSKANYELVITTQKFPELNLKDSRVTVDNSNPENREELYNGFDAMLLPRRYAGLCLPMNEALISGLPVFMTDISPNNLILPKKWLIKSEHINSFQAKSLVDVYDGNPEHLASIVDEYMDNKDKREMKDSALQIGLNHFAKNNLKDKYLDLIAHM
jgi:glycosyltransferase involved in cell wall biosynthesis